jgi:hypothetical protein
MIKRSSFINLNRIFVTFGTTIAILLFFTHCAQITSPTGGKKDETPPLALKYSPQNESTNFSAQTITITFDEFFVLENASEQVLISPILKPKPNFKIKGKSLVIDLKECVLQDSTTYTFFFGEAIKDLHENNILHDFYYVFSTGDYVDSLSIRGFVQNAFDLKPQEKTFVMLYTCTNDTIPCDSLPYRVQPKYIAQTKTDGSFTLRNLSEKDFRIFALKDQNRNFIFDMGEEIAFLDSLITPKVVAHDCNHHADSLMVEQDSLQTIATDTVFQQGKHNHIDPDFVELFMFTELDSTIRILKNEVLDSVHIQISFSCPTAALTFSTISPSTENVADSIPWNVTLWSKERDTATVWFPYFINDSIYLVVNHKDIPLDTLEFTLKKQSVLQPTKRKGSVETEIVAPKLNISNNVSGRFPFFLTLELKFDAPIFSCTTEGTRFFIGNDTIGMPPPLFHKSDSYFQKLSYNYRFKEKTSYKMLIPSGAFTDILGRSNDSITISFTTDDTDIYGTLLLDVTIPEDAPPLLLQLLTEKEQVLQQHSVTQNVIVNFGYLKPAKMMLKVIYDTNNNGKWDAGNYLKKIQPESVRYFDKIIEIRANWDIEEEWDIADRHKTDRHKTQD